MSPISFPSDLSPSSSGTSTGSSANCVESGNLFWALLIKTGYAALGDGRMLTANCLAKPILQSIRRLSAKASCVTTIFGMTVPVSAVTGTVQYCTYS